MGIDQTIDAAFAPVADITASVVFYAEPFSGYDIKLILVWLVLAGLFFTFYFGLVNLLHFGHALSILRGKYDKPGSDGQISSFQALMTSLSGTVGLGNIAGVAVAVSVGGPGAVFWMILMGLFGMSTRFVEASLAVKYRRHNDPDHPEKISGGPMYYLEAAFDKLDMKPLGVVFAVIFALSCVGGAIGAGCMFQANQSFQQIVNVTGGVDGFMGDKGWLYGLGLAVLVGLVIIGGIKSIATVTSKIVPVMGVVYVGAGIVILAMNYQDIPSSLLRIVEEAFMPEAGLGGLIGVLLVGVQRASFSNEAGLGGSAIVHATAQVDHPVRQGFVAMLGPFIDTVVICTVTALVIIVTGSYDSTNGMEGVDLTSRAFEKDLSFFPYILAFTVFLFAYSTAIAWSYYGLKAVTYLFGENDRVELVYKILFCACLIIGASAALGSIINFSDAMVLSMGITNIVGLYLLAPELKRDLKSYFERFQK